MYGHIDQARIGAHDQPPSVSNKVGGETSNEYNGFKVERERNNVLQYHGPDSLPGALIKEKENLPWLYTFLEIPTAVNRYFFFLFYIFT